jgi:hypothetical protein
MQMSDKEDGCFNTVSVTWNDDADVGAHLKAPTRALSCAVMAAMGGAMALSM